MKFSPLIAFALLSTVAITLANPIYKRAASPEIQHQNAADAKALNQKFASLSPNTPCTEDACVGDQFAKCASGQYVLMPCATGTLCVALPLVNKRGTSITCDTAADRDARIAAAEGAGGSPTSNMPTSTSNPPTNTTAPSCNYGCGSTNSTTPSTNATDIASIRKQNAADALALQKQYDSLSSTSPCNAGDMACIGGEFAQCVSGSYVLTACGPETQCFVLPLVNKKGTSITCDTQADRDARFQAAQSGQ